MKKKRLYATLLIAALLASSGGKIWGQAGAILSPDGNPTGTVKVNNAFGAGESSIISNGTSATRNILGPNFTLTPLSESRFLVHRRGSLQSGIRLSDGRIAELNRHPNR